MPIFGIVNTDVLNLRAGPGTTFQIIRQLKQGATLEVLSDSTPEWLSVRVDAATTGFVARQFVRLTDMKPEPPAPDRRAQVTAAAGVNMRTGPGTNFSIMTAIPNGVIVDVLGQDGDWYHIRYNANEGYAAVQFLTLVTTTTPTRGYLMEDPELMSFPLVPDRILPAQPVRSSEATVARVWNSYGGLVGKLAGVLNLPASITVAVLAAESGGNAFAVDGRMTIRFENHIFYDQWGKNNQDVFFRYFQFDRSAPSNYFKGHLWRSSETMPYQAFHGVQSLEWDVLTFARSLNDSAALMSISMGAPQIMGFNYRSIGYSSVQAMFDAFSRSANAQLIALFDFVRGSSSQSRTSPAVQALQKRDFVAFASIYNGAGNAQTYGSIIRNYTTAFEKIIPTAKART